MRLWGKNDEMILNIAYRKISTIYFVKGDKNGNTFVIDKPSDELCKKYQLSTFNFLGKECAHIIIFPYHKIDDIKCLISDIKNDKIKLKLKSIK